MYVLQISFEDVVAELLLGEAGDSVVYLAEAIQGGLLEFGQKFLLDFDVLVETLLAVE